MAISQGCSHVISNALITAPTLLFTLISLTTIVTIVDFFPFALFFPVIYDLTFPGEMLTFLTYLI